MDNPGGQGLLLDELEAVAGAADNGVSTNPAAIRFTRTGVSSSARFFVMAGSAAVSAEMRRGLRPCAGRRRKAR